MNIEERKHVIINFIKDHSDCTADELVKGVSEKISRTLVFRYLPDLINDKIVLDNSKNRRDHKLSINNQNLLLEVQEELEVFQKAFFELIQKTEIIAKNKDYSVISKEIGLSNEEPKKWTNEDYKKYLSYLLTGLEKFHEDFVEISSFVKEEISFIKEKETKLDQFLNFSNKKNFKLNSDDIKKTILLFDEVIESSDQIINAYNNSINSYKKILSTCDTSIILVDILSIFYYIRDIFFFRSIIWSRSISKEMLLKINNIIFNSFIEIQNRLTKLIPYITSSFDSHNILKILVEQLKGSKRLELMSNTRDKFFLYHYKEFGLETEIINVIYSLSSKIGRDLEQFGLSQPKLGNINKDFFHLERQIKSITKLKDEQKRLKLYYSQFQ